MTARKKPPAKKIPVRQHQRTIVPREERQPSRKLTFAELFRGAKKGGSR